MQTFSLLLPLLFLFSLHFPAQYIICLYRQLSKREKYEKKIMTSFNFCQLKMQTSVYISVSKCCRSFSSLAHSVVIKTTEFVNKIIHLFQQTFPTHTLIWKKCITALQCLHMVKNCKHQDPARQKPSNSETFH